MTYTRKCKNWLLDFARWTLPRCEAPESFVFWTGLFVLASAVRRHIKIPKRLMGSYEISPNMYVMFVAPPGKRKSTTADYAEDLLNDLPEITRSPERITKEALLATLVKSPDSSIYIIAKEFGEFIAKSGPDMYSFLTDGFDTKRKMDASTLSRGEEYVKNPCVNMLAATTPKWIAEHMSESVIGGGFASRPVFIYEENVRRRKMYYTDVDQDEINTIRRDLIADLSWISKNIHGEFDISEDVRSWVNDWYIKEAERVHAVDEKLQGFIERKPVLVHKVALLLHIAQSDDLILTLDDFKRAIEVVNLIEPKIIQTFQAVGKNPYTADLKSILKFISSRDRVFDYELKREFFHVAMPEVLDKILQALIDSNYITLGLDPNKPEGKRRFYKVMNGINPAAADNRTHAQPPADHRPDTSGKPQQDH